MTLNRAMRQLGVLIGLAVLSGCSTRPRQQAEVAPEALMATSKQQFRQGRFSAARLGFQRVAFEIPANDPLGAEARYYQSECEYAMGEYLEASRGFQRIADDYPDHALASEGLLRSGDALSALWTRAELDPTYGDEAMAQYRELVARYPDSRAAGRARIRLATLANRYAEKNYRAGVFYYRLKAYDSAIIYFRSVAADHGESPYAPEALVMLVETYRKLSYAEETRETCAHLRQYYPNASRLNEVCPAAPAAP